MIEILPNPYQEFICPQCHAESIQVKDSLFQGIHILADCLCQECGYEFLADYPIGHALMYPSRIGKKDKVFYPHENSKWFTKPLYASFLNPSREFKKVEKKVFQEYKEVIILNCVDFLYGHSLLKLLNAQQYLERYPEKGLIIIIGKNFEWLLPQGIAEAWLLDIRLSEARNWYLCLEDFFRDEIQRFEGVYLSLAYSHPDFSKTDLSRFTGGIQKFDLDLFERTPYTLSFIIREDRLWMGSYLEEFCFLVFQKLKIFKHFAPVLWFFLWLQKNRICALARKLKKSYPDLQFQLIGLGKTFAYPAYIRDFREKKLDEQIEKEWLRLYAASHLSVGIHGSNMLLPTALSGGFIELLPHDRYGNLTQDIGSSLQGAKAWFLGRFLEGYASSGKVAGHIKAIFRHYPQFKKNTDSQYQPYKVLKSLKDWFQS